MAWWAWLSIGWFGGCAWVILGYELGILGGVSDKVKVGSIMSDYAWYMVGMMVIAVSLAACVIVINWPH